MFSSDALENRKVHLCIVIFNLGLSFHLRSFKRNEERRKSECLGQSTTTYNHCAHEESPLLIHKALSLYKVSYELLSELLSSWYHYNDGPSTPRNAIVDVLFMALLNNMGSR